MASFIDRGSDLFSYDQRTCSNQILLSSKTAKSKVEYDEYVVYNRPDEDGNEAASDYGRLSSDHVAHRFSQDETSGAIMLDLAFRQGFTLDRNGDFTGQTEDEDRSAGLHGRVRRVICFRRKAPFEGAPDLLSMTAEDVDALNIHPATLQYATRIGTESRFWSRDRSLLNIILSFPETPRTPCDFLSMTYNVYTKSATILIRQSWEPRRHSTDDLDEYDHRLESCRDHWAHPLVMPVILLQVQFMRCEEAVTENSLDVIALEEEVGSTVGPEGAAAIKKLQRRLSNDRGKDQSWGPMNMTHMMKKSHEVLRGSIKLLDTIRWMERAVKLLILAGDELSERFGGTPMPMPLSRDLNMGGEQFGTFDRVPSPSPYLAVPSHGQYSPRPRTASVALSEELSFHWHEIRQYLEGLLRLSMSLETERRMSEARCRAQIDMIYSRMAQEDNVLNARMAVSSSRDSSSMKALAVITAIFLPGEFIGTLFGMSMFDWLVPSKEDNASSGGGGGTKTGGEDEPEDILSGYFWIYWAICIPLTLFIIILWRAWWVTQDRYFRRHLSRELSEERYWTSDGQPRKLEHNFLHDMVYLSSRRDEISHTPDPEPEPQRPTIYGPHKEWTEGLTRTNTRMSSIRQRQILSAREFSLQQRATTLPI